MGRRNLIEKLPSIDYLYTINIILVFIGRDMIGRTFFEKGPAEETWCFYRKALVRQGPGTL